VGPQGDFFYLSPSCSDFGELLAGAICPDGDSSDRYRLLYLKWGGRMTPAADILGYFNRQYPDFKALEYIIVERSAALEEGNSSSGCSTRGQQPGDFL